MAVNMQGLTPGQRASVQHVQGPLLVSAGAGSGKTFTLTQRIAYAFTPESGGGTPVVRDIDELCAITFTEKAAAEIKARVKRTLREQGLREQALRVDAAWISTIHGMCARILRTHALELGIDPGFAVLDDKGSADLIEQAIDGAVGPGGILRGSGTYAPLFADYAARSAMRNQTSVKGMLQCVLEAAANVRGGLDAAVLSPAAGAGAAGAGAGAKQAADSQAPAAQARGGGSRGGGARAIVRELLLAYEDAAACIAGAKPGKTSDTARTKVQECIDTLNRLLEDGGGPDMPSLFEELYFVPRTFGSADTKAGVALFQQHFGRLAAQAALLEARQNAQLLLQLAREVKQRYEQAKHDACVLDNNDLLVLTLRAFEEHPGIAQRYADRFKLVMVDEFQDTSLLQIQLISHLAGADSQRLCTVGDSQQSIYRFRGADVNVYEAHKRDMRSERVGARYVELNRNFRSHADVLSLVDCIFARDDAFGSAFMSLEPCPGRASAWNGGARISVVLSEKAGRGGESGGYPGGGDPSGSGGSGPGGYPGGGDPTGSGGAEGEGTAASVRAACAAGIADAFARMRAAGAQGGDMVVLLGKMTHADTYAQAVRERGFECVIAGGSLFARADEVQIIGRLCQVLVYPQNTAALFDVLASDLFAYRADDFVDLATAQRDDGRIVRRALDAGFAQRESWARSVMEDAARTMREQGLSAAVREVVVRSGWLARLETQGAQGMARAANVCKALRYVQRIECEGAGGLCATADRIADELAAGMKEAPGALSAGTGDTVRIMTIHASKGLEFPIVAVAEFDAPAAPEGRLTAVTRDGAIELSLLPGKRLDDFPAMKKRAKAWIDAAKKAAVADGTCAEDACAGSACADDAWAQRHAQLVAYNAAEERAEALRKLYVALTRASEALVVGLQGAGGDERSLTSVICAALFGGEFPAEDAAEFDFGGTAPGYFVRVRAEQGGAAALDVGMASGSDGNAAGSALGADAADVAVAADAAVADAAVAAGAAAGATGATGSAVGMFFAPALLPPPASVSCAYAPLREGVFSYSSLAARIGHGTGDAPEQPDGSVAVADDAGLGAGVAGNPAAAEDVASERAGADAQEAAGTEGLDVSAPRGGIHAGSADVAEAADDAAVRAPADADKATDLGSAFHRLAQYAVEVREVPPRARVDAIARAYGVSESQRARLDAALEYWFSSWGWHFALQSRIARAELPFFVSIGPCFMEGEIDLFCADAPADADVAADSAADVPGGSHATVFDYKTGGYAGETDAQLKEKHGLQARCYAYAVLLQGYRSVDLHFVRVEQRNEVSFSFRADDLPGLRAEIETLLASDACPHHD